MGRILVAVAITAGLVSAHATAARACDRAATPLETPRVAASLADLVITAEVTAIAGGVATVTVDGVLKAPPNPPSAGAALAIRGVTGVDAGRDCGVFPIAVGRRYVFVLWAPAGRVAEYQLVDAIGGVIDATPDGVRTYQAAIASAVATPSSSASQVTGAVESWLVHAPDPQTPGQIDLVVLVRNVGARPVRWAYRSWPLARQSRCALAVTGPDGKRVAARRVPITPRDIRAYFAKHGPRYDLTLAPGDTAMLYLDRVTTAAPGWGYKERLGFLYYPPSVPGVHTVRARCTNLLPGRRAIATAPVAVAM